MIFWLRSTDALNTLRSSSPFSKDFFIIGNKAEMLVTKACPADSFLGSGVPVPWGVGSGEWGGGSGVWGVGRGAWGLGACVLFVLVGLGGEHT